MIKKNKNLLITTSIVTLLPILLGLILWGRLPHRMPMHWNFSGEIDGWSSKPFGVFFIPLFCLAMHWFIVGCMCLDPKSKNIEGKSAMVALWVMPLFCMAMSGFLYAAALGLQFSMNGALAVLLGIMYLVFGNLMPKFRHNYTIGIRVPWTLDDPEVWAKTHRMAGKLWMVGGTAILMTVFTGGFFPVLITVVLVTSIVPVGYSIYLSKK